MRTKTSLFNFFRNIFKFKLFEVILRNFVKGKKPNSFLAKLLPNNYQYKKNSWRVCNVNGIKFKVDIHDYVGHYLYFQFKDDGHDELFSLVNTKDYVLDIGTNIGTTILNFADKIGGLGKVYGFEPDKINFNLCTQNISLNNFENIYLSNIGLGDSIGSFKMITNTESNRGMNRIINEKPIENYIEVYVDTLDNWLANNPLDRIDLIKIDVEGYELKVLKGGKESIMKYSPKLFIELDDNNLRVVGDSAFSLIDFLDNELGYKHILNAQSKEKLNAKDSFVNCHFDIIAFKTEL